MDSTTHTVETTPFRILPLLRHFKKLENLYEKNSHFRGYQCFLDEKRNLLVVSNTPEDRERDLICCS